MSGQTFKVGDKVEILGARKGEVKYGPATSTFGTHTVYIVADETLGHDRAYKASDLTALPTFAVGDKAKMDGEREPVEILAGPYKNRYITWYTVKAEVGETTAAEDNLTALPALVPVGTRVRVARATYAARRVGQVGTVDSNREDAMIGYPKVAHPYLVSFPDGQDIYAAEVTPVDESADTYTYEGITYDLSAKYRDKDGDVWEFTGEHHADGSPKVYFHGSGYDDLGDVVEAYGPLTKI
jgi:hypothetical protein